MTTGENGNEILQAGWKPQQSLEIIRLFLLQAGEIMHGSIGVGGGDQQHFDLSLDFGRKARRYRGDFDLCAPRLAERDAFEQAGHALLDNLVYQRDYIVFPNRATFEDSRIEAAEAPARRGRVAGFNPRIVDGGLNARVNIERGARSAALGQLEKY